MFRVHYREDAPSSIPLKSEPVLTKADRDCTGYVILKDLEANTRYLVTIVADGMNTAGPMGSFRTFPSAKEHYNSTYNPDGLFNFSFEFGCGNNQDPSQGLANRSGFAMMNEKIAKDLTFAILNGDFIYEEERTYSPQQWRSQVGIDESQTPDIVNVAPTITGVWENYKLYLSRGIELAKWHRNVPSLFMYDDHEILNDIWGAGTPGLRDRRATFRDIGVQAWYDYVGWSNPVPQNQGIFFGRAVLRKDSNELVDENANFSKLDLAKATTLMIHWGGETAGVDDIALDDQGGDPNAGVYRIAEIVDDKRLRIEPAAPSDGEASYSIGRQSYFKKTIANCDFFVCDTRGQREMHDTRDPYKKGLSHLGKAQKEWLIDGTKNSKADFIFVFSSVNFMLPHVGGNNTRTSNKDDAWTVFFDEREQLIEHFDSLGKKVFICTGDLHNSFVGKITDRVWEIASGPHNSRNHYLTSEGDRPVTGTFKYGPRAVDLRWSTGFLPDIPRDALYRPSYCVVQINNVQDNSLDAKTPRWVAYERPQVVIQYYSALDGKLLYAESVVAESAKE
jgi:hypothetical protein